MNVTIESEALVDPRGALLRKPAALAPRLPALAGRAVLLLDNSQMAAGIATHGPLFRWLSERLRQDQNATCPERTLDLLAGGKERLIALADELAASGVDAAVIALCHAGVTQPSVLLAAELERRNIPCVVLCTELGLPLARATSATYVPGLALIEVGRATGEAESLGRSEAAAIASSVVKALAVAAGNPPVPQGSPAAAGATTPLDLPPRVAQDFTAGSGAPRVTIDPGCFVADLYERLCAEDMCDGFPVIPPTRARVDAMLRYTDLPPDYALLDECPPSGAALTVLALAANAVMAGCRPEYFPVVVAAFQAMSDPAYRLFQAAITTHPAGNAVIVSGPLSRQIGLHDGAGCLGPGFRANATIGRAITLTLMNVARAIPGKSDLAVFGSAAKFTYCFAENVEANPWTPLHADLYGPEVTSVTVHKCEGPHNVAVPQEQTPEALLRTLASTAATLGGSNMTMLGQLVVLLNPGHARMIAGHRWTKRDVREYLFEIARHPVDEVLPEATRLVNFPAHFLSLPRVPVMRSPDDVIVLVCGGTGRHSMVAVPWGLSRAVSRPAAVANGSPRRTIGPHG